MANNVIGSAVVEIRVDAKKLQQELTDLEKVTADRVRKLTTLLEKKISTGATQTEIDAIKAKISQAERAATNFKDKMDTAGKSIKQNMGSGSNELTKFEGMVKRIGERLLIYFGFRAIADFIKDITVQAAKFEEISSFFKGTAEDIEKFRLATKNTVSDMSLIKLSNQASDLGINLKDQPILFALAKRAAEAYGTDAESGFQRVTMATEGNIRGLRAIGVQKKVYEQIVKDLAKAHGGLINEFDAEAQKAIRLEAIIKASGMTLEEATKKGQSHADKIEEVGAKWENLKNIMGTNLAPFFSGMMTYLTKAIEYVGNLGKSFENLFHQMGGEQRKTGYFEAIKSYTKEQVISTQNALLGQEEATKGEIERLSNLYADLMSSRKQGKKGDPEADVNLIKGRIEANKKLLLIYQEQKSVLENFDTLKAKEGEKNKPTDYNLSPEALLARAEKANKIAQEIQKQDDEIQKQKEKNLEEYYNEVKFKDAGYLEWKSEQILRELLTEEQKNEKLKKLIDEKYEYERDKLTDQSTRGLTAEQYQAGVTTPIGGALYNRSHQDERFKELEEDEKKATHGAEQLANALSGGFGNAIMTGENLGKVLENIGAQFAGMIVQAGLLATIMSIINPSNVLGFGGFFTKSLGFGHSGGDFLGTSNGVLKLASGGSFRVPAGFPNDSFPLMVESGEKVSVTSASQTAFNDRQIVSELRSLRNEMNSIKGSGNSPIVIPIYLDGKQIAISTTQHGNLFAKGNYKVTRSQ